MPITRNLVAAAVTLLVVLAGCGGSSNSGGSSASSPADYKKQVQKIGNSFRDQVNQAQSSLASANTNDKRAKGLDKIKTAFSGVAGKIDALHPPKGAQDEQDKLVSVLRRGANDIGTVEVAIKKNDVSGITSSVKKIQTDSTDAATALDNLKNAVDKK